MIVIKEKELRGDRTAARLIPHSTCLAIDWHDEWEDGVVSAVKTRNKIHAGAIALVHDHFIKDALANTNFTLWVYTIEFKFHQ